jgi:hypothetical protein
MQAGATRRVAPLGGSAARGGLQQSQPQSCEAKTSADKDLISWVGAGTTQSFPTRGFARHDHVNRAGALDDGGVTSNHRHVKSPGESEQTVKESFYPGPVRVP